MVDRVSETEVRRVNVIIYANYGEPNARIVHGRDHDFHDSAPTSTTSSSRTHLRSWRPRPGPIIEEKEQRQVFRIKALIREYYLTKNEADQAGVRGGQRALPVPVLGAWASSSGRGSAAAGPRPLPEPAPSPSTVAVPAPEERASPKRCSIPSTRPARAGHRDRAAHHRARAGPRSGSRPPAGADDILLQTCRKLVSRAKESLSGPRALRVQRPPPRHDPQQPDDDLAADQEPPPVVPGPSLSLAIWHRCCQCSIAEVPTHGVNLHPDPGYDS